MADEQGVLVLAEQHDGKLAGISLELIAAGRMLADAMGEPLVAAVAGPDEAAQDLIAAGADRVYLLDQPELATYLEETTLPGRGAGRSAGRAARRAARPHLERPGPGAAPGGAARRGPGHRHDGASATMRASGDVGRKPVFGGMAISEQAATGPAADRHGAP